MKLYVVLHRWFPTGEGWAYSSELSKEQLEPAYQLVSRFMGKNVQEEIFETTNAFSYWFRECRDENPLDPLSKGRNPKISCGVFCFPPVGADVPPELRRAVDELFQKAMATTETGEKPELCRILQIVPKPVLPPPVQTHPTRAQASRPYTQPPSFTLTRSRALRRYGPFAVAVAALVIATATYIFFQQVETSSSVPDDRRQSSSDIQPMTRNKSFVAKQTIPQPASSLPTKLPLSRIDKPSALVTAGDDTPKPIAAERHGAYLRESREEVSFASSQPESVPDWFVAVSQALTAELRQQRRFDSEWLEQRLATMEDSPLDQVNLFFRLHSRSGLGDDLGVVKTTHPNPDRDFWLSLPDAQSPRFPNRPNKRALYHALADLAETAQVELPWEPDINVYLEKIRKRFDYRDWFVANWAGADGFVPGDLRDSPARSIAIIFTDPASFRPQPGNAPILAEYLRSQGIELADDDGIDRPWLVSTVFFKFVNSRFAQFLGKGASLIPPETIVRLSENTRNTHNRVQDAIQGTVRDENKTKLLAPAAPSLIIPAPKAPKYPEW